VHHGSKTKGEPSHGKDLFALTRNSDSEHFQKNRCLNFSLKCNQNIDDRACFMYIVCGIWYCLVMKKNNSVVHVQLFCWALWQHRKEWDESVQSAQYKSNWF
jgi:hypothetical protein